MTKAERFRRLKEMNCIACGRFGVDIHHVVTNGYRRLSGDWRSTIPLCPWCHRGEQDELMTCADMERFRGPSMARTKRAFIAKYGAELQLLAKVNEMLK